MKQRCTTAGNFGPGSSVEFCTGLMVCTFLLLYNCKLKCWHFKSNDPVSVQAVKETCANVILAFYRDHTSFYTHLYINHVFSLKVRTKKIILISQLKHILWVLKKNRLFFCAPKT